MNETYSIYYGSPSPDTKDFFSRPQITVLGLTKGFFSYDLFEVYTFSSSVPRLLSVPCHSVRTPLTSNTIGRPLPVHPPRQ